MNSIWSTFAQNSEKFFVRFTNKRLPESKDEITCWLTDLKMLYSETLCGMDEIMERVKEENRLLRVSPDTVEKVLRTILTVPSRTAAATADEITFSRANSRLHLKYCLSESVPLKFYWTLSKCNSTAFFEMLTVPLLRQLADAEERARDLVEIVKRKDLEIEQYQLDGALPLSRKQFVTKRFDANQMKSQAKPLFDCHVSDLLPANTTNAAGDVDTIHLEVISGPPDSHVDKADAVPAKCFVPKPKPNKFKRNRPYDEEFNGRPKVQYIASDDDDDDTGTGNLSNSTVKSDSSSSGSSNSTTKTTAVDNNASDGALQSTKTATKKIRKMLNL